MNKTLYVAILLLTSICQLNCKLPKDVRISSKEVLINKDLIITQISENAFVHTSYKQTQDFGYVPCNGLIVTNNQQAIVFDTPTNDSASHILIDWIVKKLHCTINAVVPTHFHDDCIGGLAAFHAKEIPSFALEKTIELAKKDGAVVPKNGFKDSLLLQIGNEKVVAKYFGEGHTKDNIIGYFPSENILFGGCLIKEIKASKGYLGDANIMSWSHTVELVKLTYPGVQIVVPGHGKFGSQKLLDYTIQLFKP